MHGACAQRQRRQAAQQRQAPEVRRHLWAGHGAECKVQPLQVGQLRNAETVLVSAPGSIVVSSSGLCCVCALHDTLTVKGLRLSQMWMVGLHSSCAPSWQALRCQIHCHPARGVSAWTASSAQIHLHMCDRLAIGRWRTSSAIGRLTKAAPRDVRLCKAAWRKPLSGLSCRHCAQAHVLWYDGQAAYHACAVKHKGGSVADITSPPSVCSAKGASSSRSPVSCASWLSSVSGCVLPA